MKFVIQLPENVPSSVKARIRNAVAEALEEPKIELIETGDIRASIRIEEGDQSTIELQVEKTLSDWKKERALDFLDKLDPDKMHGAGDGGFGD